jgi:hypothetical protein
MPIPSPGPSIWRGGRPDGDPDDTKAELLRRAREFGIEGRWTMSKRELVAALRNR